MTRYLSLAAALTVAVGVATQIAKHRFGRNYVFGLVELFDLDAEQTVPAFYTAFLLLLAAALLGSIASIRLKGAMAWGREWLALSAGFFYVALDECAAIHERLNDPMRESLGVSKHGPLGYAWIIPGAGVVLMIGLLYIRFLAALDRRHRVRFVLAAAVYLSGALGMELVGSWYRSVHYVKDLDYSFLVAIEESLEMAGVICFIRALLLYVEHEIGGFRFHFSE